MVNSFPNLPSKRLAAPFRRREPSKNSSKLIWQEPRNRTGGSTHWGVDGFGVTNSWLVHANFTCVFYWCFFLMIENSITSEKKLKKKEKNAFWGSFGAMTIMLLTPDHLRSGFCRKHGIQQNMSKCEDATDATHFRMGVYIVIYHIMSYYIISYIYIIYIYHIYMGYTGYIDSCIWVYRFMY